MLGSCWASVGQHQRQPNIAQVLASCWVFVGQLVGNTSARPMSPQHLGKSWVGVGVAQQLPNNCPVVAQLTCPTHLPKAIAKQNCPTTAQQLPNTCPTPAQHQGTTVAQPLPRTFPTLAQPLPNTCPTPSTQHFKVRAVRSGRERRPGFALACLPRAGRCADEKKAT